jgi:hypothetical protein
MCGTLILNMYAYNKEQARETEAQHSKRLKETHRCLDHRRKRHNLTHYYQNPQVYFLEKLT